MSLRLALSRLSSAEARAGTARALAIFCVAGYLLTIAVLFATGVGLRRWLFVLLVWALFVYLPLRILLEAFQTIAPGIRRTLVAQARADPARYGSRSSIELIVDSLLEREVLMPRIATPQQSATAREGAAAVLRRSTRTPGSDLGMVASRCLGTIDRWVTDLAGWSVREAPDNIQARWAGLRALASFAALSQVLTSAASDQTGRPLHLPGRHDAGEYLDSCLDYCDRLALEVDVVPWMEPPLGIHISVDDAVAIRLAWTTYAESPPPAIEARDAFVRTLLGEPAEVES